jgi:tRNA threonylcarbamoyladenosine biosynthesis protein TsaB
MQDKKTGYPVLLAIDTTTEICSVAVQTTLGKITEASHSQSTHHSQAILPLIEQILKKAQLTLKQVEYILVTVGPGSFTGVRAGIATAQGLAYGLNIPIIPFGSLDLVALGMPHTGQVQVVMDARMQQFYAASFKWEGDDKFVNIQPPCLCTETELLEHLSIYEPSGHANIALVGTGIALIQDKLHSLPYIHINTNKTLNYPQAKNLIDYLNKPALISDLSPLAIKAMSLSPLYIRNEVATPKK